MTTTTTCPYDTFALAAAETVKFADDDEATVYLVVGSGTMILLCFGSRHYLQTINISGSWVGSDKVVARFDLDHFKQLAHELASVPGSVDPNQITINVDDGKVAFEFAATTQILTADIGTDEPDLHMRLIRANGGPAVQCTMEDNSRLVFALTSPASNLHIKGTADGLYYGSYHLGGASELSGLILS